MKFLFDNNLSPHFALALHELCQGASRYQIIPLGQKFPRNTPDHEWITALSVEGGWSIVSQDGFRKNDLEREALRKCGLAVFVLSKQWMDHTYWTKAQNLVKWWPAIEDYQARIQGGAAVRIPWRMTGRFEQIRL
ncbi:hypothetical protein ACFO0J_01145 [Castellaniella hirudinis]|uniref:VapC45 PIN like domain-containing protein n=1 Tax=Castellaniella hirudinis TaxID=1144617 RepID=A0ABV8RTC8_9BURK